MIAADYFDGRSSRRQAVTLRIAEGSVTVEGEFGRRSAQLAQTLIREDAGGGLSTIQFPDGALCEIHDRASFAAQLASAGQRPSAVSSAERHWHLAVAALAGAIVIIVAGYAFALPWIAERIAPMIPATVTRSISDAALQGLDSRLLAPSRLTPRRQQELTAKVAALAGAGARLPPYRLLFRAGPTIGPNAFALPGGDVVILDELLALARRDEDVVAVVAHELGHLEYRHGMRQLLQSAVVSFAVGVYLGDVSTIVAGLTALLLDSRYSREFEGQADAYAGRLLLTRLGSLEPLTEMLRRLEDAHNKRDAAHQEAPFNVTNMLSSHPDTAARIEALQAMARR